MADVLKASFGPHAWQPFRADLPGLSGAFLLMAAGTGFTTAREIVSNRDLSFVTQAVRAVYPNDELIEVGIGRKRYLARRPSNF
jgi:hypothetical protein